MLVIDVPRQRAVVRLSRVAQKLGAVRIDEPVEHRGVRLARQVAPRESCHQPECRIPRVFVPATCPWEGWAVREPPLAETVAAAEVDSSARIAAADLIHRLLEHQAMNDEPIEVRYESINYHPPGRTERIVAQVGDPGFRELVDALRYAAFPRPPITFSLGRTALLPGETTGTLSVRGPRGEHHFTSFANYWNEDPGYRRVFNILKPHKPSLSRFTVPSGPELVLSYRVGSSHTHGCHWLQIMKGGKVSLLFEHQAGSSIPQRLTAKGTLATAEQHTIIAALHKIRWPNDEPPFNVAHAMNGHTPASIGLTSARDDEGQAAQMFAFEQRRNEPRWAALFDALDPVVQTLAQALA